MRPRNAVLLGRETLGPLIVALVPLFWVVDATYRASLATLGRDQGIFQYVAWAVRRGAVDYSDVRDVNGPLTHLLHLVMLSLGGADEHRFHVIDLTVNGVVFAFVGACLPGLLLRGKRASIASRVAWAAAAWVVLSAQYTLYLYWDQAQRESFCDWFLLPSVALQLAVPAATARGAARRIALVGALSVTAWFGKPSFVVFTVAQALALLLDDRLPLLRLARLGWLAAGGALGTIAPLAYLFRYGDARAYLQIATHDVPEIYRFIWARSAPEIFGDDGTLTATALGLAAGTLVLALVLVRALPRRTLIAAFLPLAAVANVVVQHKGFAYHFHPLTAATWICALIVVVALWERHRSTPKGRGPGRIVALAAAAALAWFVTSGMRGSAQMQSVWILAEGETAELRAGQEYLQHYESDHFFPWEMRQTADFLREYTSPNARVQIYGMDPYLLFLAERLSATPYIYAYDLNPEAALDGGWSNRPTWTQALHIKQASEDHEHDMLARLRDAPPAAFVFIDHSPFVAYTDAHEDFAHACPGSATFVDEGYREARAFGPYHVWVRNDLPIPAGPPTPPR